MKKFEVTITTADGKHHEDTFTATSLEALFDGLSQLFIDTGTQVKELSILELSTSPLNLRSQD